MKNGDYIRNMDNDRLSRFLWTFCLNTMSSFMQYGGMRVMDGKQLREWLDKEDFICEQTLVGEDMFYDQEFNIKEERP